MSKSTAIKVGVTDFYAAVATLDTDGTTVTYGTPKVIGGTARVGVSVSQGENKVYESDQLIRNNKRAASATITYESRTVSMEDEMELLHGLTAVAGGEYEDGPDNQPKNVAVGWARRMSDGTYKCVWYYWCTGSKGDESDETATDAESSNTETYTFEAMAAPDNNMLRRRAVCENKTAMAAFFASVRKTTTGTETPGEGNGEGNG